MGEHERDERGIASSIQFPHYWGLGGLRNSFYTVSQTRHAPLSISERNARLIALLDSFDDGDPEQQCQDFDVLQAGLEAARPGRHCLFGPCVNP